MVTAGILGGIASRNAALPRLAITQIFIGTIPIGIGALLAPRGGAWILVPPLFAYLAAMVSVVQPQGADSITVYLGQARTTLSCEPICHLVLCQRS